MINIKRLDLFTFIGSLFAVLVIPFGPYAVASVFAAIFMCIHYFEESYGIDEL